MDTIGRCTITFVVLLPYTVKPLLDGCCGGFCFTANCLPFVFILLSVVSYQSGNLCEEEEEALVEMLT